MEHLDIINRIIEAEQQAQKIAGEAASAKEHLNETISVNREKIHEDYMSRADRRIEIVRNSEKETTDEAIAKLDELLKQKLATVESTYTQNRERWIDTLFGSVVGS
ncbi:MAG: hypothetical protein Q8878_07125 [Bacillota bacterium]|nr:hypothetical protein [Bacillota bacterium]